MTNFLDTNIVFSKFCNKYLDLKGDMPIRPSEMGVLTIIIKREGPFTPVMIAEMLEVSKPMVTAHIRRLEKLGYIYKEYSKTDKRSFFVMPTDKAETLVKEKGLELKNKLASLQEEMGQENFENMVLLLEKANNILTNINDK